jgi:hypothetical protein
VAAGVLPVCRGDRPRQGRTAELAVLLRGHA